MHCEISSKLTIMTPEWCQLCHPGVFIVNCTFHNFSNASIVDFEQVNICWVAYTLKQMILLSVVRDIIQTI